MSRGPVGLSVVIVTWKSLDYLRDCLISLRSQESPYEIIVINNSSGDGTAEMVRDEFPEVTLLENSVNVGFARACNQGILQSRGEVILLLNPDTRVLPGSLEACISYLDAHQEVGAVGCRLVWPDGRVQYECARRLPSLLTMLIESLYLHMLFPRHWLFGRHLLGNWDHLSDSTVSCISGAFMMIPRRVIGQIGMLDEDLPMYLEDVDYCKRMWKEGYAIQYLATPCVIHLGGRSRARSSFDFDQLEGQVRYRYFRKHHGTLAAASARIIVCWSVLLRIFLYIPAATATAVFVPGRQFGSLLSLRSNCRILLWALGLRRLPRLGER